MFTMCLAIAVRGRTGFPFGPLPETLLHTISSRSYSSERRAAAPNRAGVSFKAFRSSLTNVFPEERHPLSRTSKADTVYWSSDEIFYRILSAFPCVIGVNAPGLGCPAPWMVPSKPVYHRPIRKRLHRAGSRSPACVPLMREVRFQVYAGSIPVVRENGAVDRSVAEQLPEVYKEIDHGRASAEGLASRASGR